MQAMTERFEMRLDQGAIERVDEWRDHQDVRPSRAEAVRRLVEAGLSVSGRGRIKLTDGEKLILLMLCEVYKHLKMDGEIDPKFIEAAIHGGHYWGLRWKYVGIFHGHADNESTVSEVSDVLVMWWLIESGYGKLSKKDKARIAAEAVPFGKHVTFPGFDGNSEGEHVGIAHYLVNDLDRFPGFKSRDLNSHAPMIEAYRRMLPVFEPMRRNIMGRELDAAQIIELLTAMVHPEHRKS